MYIQQRKQSWLIMNWKLLSLENLAIQCWESEKNVRKCEYLQVFGF